MYTSRAFQNGIASQNILIFVGTSSVDVKKYILEKCKKKKKKIASFIAFLIINFFWNFNKKGKKFKPSKCPNVPYTLQ